VTSTSLVKKKKMDWKKGGKNVWEICLKANIFPIWFVAANVTNYTLYLTKKVHTHTEL